MRTVTVVGASLSGLYAARELRAQGFDGRLVIVGDEPHRPYDRPPLSKDFLTGRADETQLALTDAEETAELDAEWLLGARARGLDARGRTVLLDDGRTVSTDGVVIATGASARRLPGDGLLGVHTLRTLDDARALRAELSGGRAVSSSSAAVSSAPRPRPPAPDSATTSPSSRPHPCLSSRNSARRWPPCAPPCTAVVASAS